MDYKGESSKARERLHLVCYAFTALEPAVRSQRRTVELHYSAASEHPRPGPWQPRRGEAHQPTRASHNLLHHRAVGRYALSLKLQSAPNSALSSVAIRAHSARARRPNGRESYVPTKS